MLELNTLGDPESRAAYRDALVGYFSARVSELSEDSRRRLERNPLRILDSKDPGDQRLAAEAPDFAEYLNDASREFFARVRDGLDRLGIAYRLNPRLVRGLDYYTHTAFEFVTTDLGAQGTVIGGGRYDGLVELMGGPAMLKPALARGELHCVGATTLDEYRKHIEKDAALARRFQPVFVSEPSVEDTISILRGIKEKYELHHGVRITDSALVAAATLSNRYITDRFLPDKAIDLVDEAASRLRMPRSSIG